MRRVERGGLARAGEAGAVGRSRGADVSGHDRPVTSISSGGLQALAIDREPDWVVLIRRYTPEEAGGDD